jgi:hypothetical protein
MQLMKAIISLDHSGLSQEDAKLFFCSSLLA